MTAWYNENEPFAARWLTNLIDAGHLPAGDVDTRSIVDIAPDDLRAHGQAHFFAGIGGWAYALELAGWPTGRPVWTGSCPCQPFSAAGRGDGAADPRHLWPAWFRLIRECRPRVVFGEQVDAAVQHGWLDAVFSDLEGEGYACGAAVLGAHSVGAPHRRQRVFFVAESDGAARERFAGGVPRAQAEGGREGELDGCLPDGPRHGGATGELALPDPGGLGVLGTARVRLRPSGDDADRCGTDGATGGLADAECGRLESGSQRSATPSPDQLAAGSWQDLVWLPCTDGKARPVEPGIFPLAHGVPGRVGRLRAYGNAIVPQVAAAFVRAWMEVRA